MTHNNAPLEEEHAYLGITARGSAAVRFSCSCRTWGMTGTQDSGLWALFAWIQHVERHQEAMNYG